VSDDKRLIEDFIPIEAINEVAQREKIGHAALHPRKLHLWWARRPLAAARAAVFATLMRAEDATDHERSATYFKSLCGWGASDMAIAEARKRILESNGGVPPRVLDLFAGGGAIPLEAQRLGCEATAVELNPVAHLIQRCMLEFPQRYGPGLANDIRKYGARWVDAAWDRVGHLYPRARDEEDPQLDMSGDTAGGARAQGRPIAYLWTRTVPCPNTELAAHVVPLVRQTWLAKKKDRFVALKPVVDRDALTVGWEVLEAPTAEGLGFDPAGFSTRGRTSCLACGAAVDATYVKASGKAGLMGIMPLAAVLVKPSGRGRDYFAAGDYPDPDLDECEAVLDELEVEPPEEPIESGDARNFWTPLYGLTRFRDLFTPRQLATLCALGQGVGEAHTEMVDDGMEEERAAAVATYLGLVLDRLTDSNSNLCRWRPQVQTATNTYARQALPMVWDFSEANPFARSVGDAATYVRNQADIVAQLSAIKSPAMSRRASATQLPDPSGSFDAVITDPPYTTTSPTPTCPISSTSGSSVRSASSTPRNSGGS
jgi:putative DNA methylase